MWSACEIRSLNGLVAVGYDKFYFTNDIEYCFIMEAMFRLPFGSIGFYNGSAAHLVVEDLFIPNGLALSDDKKCVDHDCLLSEVNAI